MIDHVLIFLDYIDVLIDNYYFFSLCIYSIFCFLFFLLSLPGSLLIILSSGFFFGFYIGFLINIISITVGSLIFVMLSKFLFLNIFKNYMSKYLYKLNTMIKKSSYEYLILIRLTFGIPLIVQNLFISTLEISKIKLFISSIIGFTPYFLIFTYAGDKLSDLIDIKSFSISSLFSIELLVIILVFVGIIIFRIITNINSKKN